MKASAEALLHVRAPVRPRPDALPQGAPGPWALHAPWALSFLAFALPALFLERPAFGVFAAGAGLAIIVAATARARVRTTCEALHLAAGVIVLGVLRSTDEAGTFALAAGTTLSAALAGRAWALHVRPEVAPLAGRVQWRFRSVHRDAALRFALAGLAVGVPLALFASVPVLRVIGVAMLPLALRSYMGSLMSVRASRALWCLAAALNLAVLGFFAPEHGAIAAAWAVVAAETTLFAGSALVVSRRTGVTPLPLVQLACLLLGAVVVTLLTIPGPDYTLLIGVVLGFAGAAAWWRRRQKSK